MIGMEMGDDHRVYAGKDVLDRLGQVDHRVLRAPGEGAAAVTRAEIGVDQERPAAIVEFQRRVAEKFELHIRLLLVSERALFRIPTR